MIYFWFMSSLFFFVSLTVLTKLDTGRVTVGDLALALVVSSIPFGNLVCAIALSIKILSKKAVWDYKVF